MTLKEFLGKVKSVFAKMKLPKIKTSSFHKKKKGKPSTLQEAFRQTGSKVHSKFDTKQKYKRRRMSLLLREFLERAGHDESPKEFNKKLLFADLIIMGIFSFFIIVFSIAKGSVFSDVLTVLLLLWTIVLLGLYLISLLVVFIYFDIKIYQRTKQIEEVLPDFLQLASANISAGMPIDRALWYAVRPRFGVLATEMEEIAKATFTGSELEDALIDFTRRYNSRILKEAINLIIAGLRSGGEIAELLTKISENIQATRLMKKEISASVTTYVIFIAIASIAAAPALFALSSQLLSVITHIASSFQGTGSAGTGGLSMSFSGDSISMSDFTTFAIVLLTITSYFASAIVATIRTGNSKEGLKQFPIFAVVALAIFFVAKAVLGLLMNGLF